MTGWRCGWVVGPKRSIAGGQRAAEPLDVERELDHAEGRDRGADRAAGVRDARCWTSISARRDQLLAWLGRGAAAALRRCRRARSICFPTSATSCRPTACAPRSSSPTALLARRARRDDGRRSVRHAGLPPALVRDVARPAARRARRASFGSRGSCESRARVLSRTSARVCSTSSSRSSGAGARARSTRRRSIAYGTDALKRGHPRRRRRLPATRARRSPRSRALRRDAARRSCRAAAAPATPAAPCRCAAASCSASSG